MKKSGKSNKGGEQVRICTMHYGKTTVDVTVNIAAKKRVVERQPRKKSASTPEKAQPVLA
jgi:hypothetical protein